MNRQSTIPYERIRLVFELERDDNPRLYDDLIRFKKGTKRVNRLRTLAQEGLLAQHWPAEFAGQILEVRNQARLRTQDDASITNQVFDPPITE